MTKALPKYPRVLGIAPSTRGFGFALVEGLNTLVDWGVKRFEMIDGRPVLTEAVEFKQLEPLMARLAAVERPKTGLFAINSTRQIKHAHERARFSPERFRAFAHETELQLASAPLREPAVIVDYELQSGSNFTFRADTTYYVSGQVYLYETNTFEGGAVIKYTNGASLIVTIGPPLRVNWQADSYRPVIFTAKDDNSVGETISGSSGSPTGYYADTAFSLIAPASDPAIAHFKIAFAKTAISLTGTSPVLSDGQIVNCQNGVTTAGSAASLRNVLFANVATNFSNLQGASLSVEHGTFAGSAYLATAPESGSSIGLTNCIFANVTNLSSIVQPTGSYNGFYNSPSFGTMSNSTSTFPFKAAGAGYHYLTNGISFRSAGTTNINADLLAALRKKTTYPPTILSNITISVSTNLPRQAIRDTNSLPDLGFHYESLDYLVDSCVITNATVSLSNGVAIAYDNAGSGFSLQNGSTMNSVGTPSSPNWFVHYTFVQEQPVLLGGSFDSGDLGINSYHDGSPAPSGVYRFTKFIAPANHYSLYHYSSWAYTNLLVQDCELWSGANVFSGASGSVATLKNNLFHRSSIYGSTFSTTTLTLSNNLVWGTSATFLNFPSDNLWRFHDNAFDTCTISAATKPLTNSHNAYINCTATDRLYPTNVHDVVLTNLAYTNGPLGDFYQPSDSSLINHGSTDAYSAGLYHYTTTTNQVKETNSIVDIGLHYVTVNNGVAADLDGDGIADYADSDADGDNMPDSWEVANGLNPLVNDASDDPDGDWLTNYQEYNGGTNSTNPRDVMVVAWGRNHAGQCNVPAGLRNVVTVAGGNDFSCALRSDGTIVAWGANGVGQTTVPPGLSNAVAMAASWQQTVAAKATGSVTNWGLTDGSIPSDLTNAVSVAVGAAHTLALRSNGQIAAWGNNTYNKCTVPTSVTNPVAVAAGWDHSIALQANGTVAAWGLNGTNFGWFMTNVPASLSNVIAVATGGDHTLALRSDGTVVAWGAGTTNTGQDGNLGQSIVPAGVSNVVAIAGGGYSSLALRTNGTVVGWGDDLYGQTSGAGSLTGLVSIGAGTWHSLALRSGRLTPFIWQQPVSQARGAGANVTLSALAQGLAGVNYQWQFKGVTIPGATNSTFMLTNLEASLAGAYTVVMSTGAGSLTSQVASVTLTNSGTNTFGTITAWGSNTNGEGVPPFGLQQVLSMAAGKAHGLAVKDGGTMVGWGENTYGKATPPAGLSNFVAVAAGENHSLALKENGTILAWGRNTESQTNVPTGVTNVIAIAAAGNQSMALLNNGTVTNWGTTFGSKPSDLTNAIAVAAGTNFCLALRTNGIVVSWGANTSATNIPAGLSNVVAVAAGGSHSLALKQDGTVTAWGLNTSGQTNVPSGLSNVMTVAAGHAHSVALKNDGTVIAWGDNSAGQTNVVSGLTLVKSIAAGGSLSLAASFSPLLQYPVDVSKDLLLIYNTNSLDSSNICFYYIQHRPMVGAANVLGIGYSNSAAPGYYETITPTDLTNHILTPMKSWLGANPTKRPEYVILFLDLPSRVSMTTTFPTNGAYHIVEGYASVSVQLQAVYSGWSPVLAHINMNGTNDCIAYINKLASFATNSPGKVVLSAKMGAYGNTNYVLDGIRYGGPLPYLENYSDAGDFVASATNGLLAEGILTSEISFSDGLEVCIATNGSGGCIDIQELPHLTTATNVAGYICWGAHSTLGANYALNGNRWFGNSAWWIIETIESFNGLRVDPGQGTFIKWFSSDAFGGTNYSNTPVGAVTHVDEPFGLINNSKTYFGLWARGKNFAISAWQSRQTPFFQAVGDPFVTR